MKDIPIFTGTEGICSLVLREIPSRATAYVLLRSVFSTTEALCREAEGFCRAAGAITVCFSGNGDFSTFTPCIHVLRREVLCSALQQTNVVAVPVVQEQAAQWLALYRARFTAVPAASSTVAVADAFFIYDGEARIGLGQIRGSELLSVASLVPKRGADCVCALAALCSAKTLSLQCAQENVAAMRLYDRLGFSAGEQTECWYCRK